jgi:hypothetical protein
MRQNRSRIVLLALAALHVFGCANRLAFATATKFGLDISQRPDQTFEVTMGYDRTELASIPVPKRRDATADEDSYSVLGTFCVAYGNPFAEIIGQGKPLTISQRFATGMAAQELSKNPNFVNALANVYKEEAEEAEENGGDHRCD